MVSETLLYSVYGEDILDFDKCEHPIVCQLGGGDPDRVGEAAKMVAEKGYDAINLNCGCPSNKVFSHDFGAVLMLDPERVSKMVLAIQRVTSLPVTVKCRIGVDDHDSYEELVRFISIVSGVSPVAELDSSAEGENEPRCILQGLGTKENRSVPPLQYSWVYRLLDDFPTIDFTINGGISSYAEMKTLLDRESLSRSSDLMHSERLHRKVKGVMIGRMVMKNPYLLRHIDKCFYGVPDPGLSRRQIVEKYVDYVEHFLATHHKWKPNATEISRPLLTLFAGVRRGGSVFRKSLQDKLTVQKIPFREAVFQSLRCFDDAVLDEVDEFDPSEMDKYCVEL
ncbi:hypothetical protein BLSTO_04594 [Blastocystis sp. subtype 1]